MIKEIVKEAVNDNKSYSYSPTKGLLETREFLAKSCNSNGYAKITTDDIIFFNGLGDAISKIYTNLNKESRIIGPSPAYSTPSTSEAAHAGSHHLTYNLIPKLGWLPDINDLRNKVRYNPAISGILIINPDNPTGMVYPRRVLEEIVKITEEYDLFIISDEIYSIFSTALKIPQKFRKSWQCAGNRNERHFQRTSLADARCAGLKFIIKTKILFLKNILNQLPTKNA